MPQSTVIHYLMMGTERGQVWRGDGHWPVGHHFRSRPVFCGPRSLQDPGVFCWGFFLWPFTLVSAGIDQIPCRWTVYWRLMAEILRGIHWSVKSVLHFSARERPLCSVSNAEWPFGPCLQGLAQKLRNSQSCPSMRSPLQACTLLATPGSQLMRTFG